MATLAFCLGVSASLALLVGGTCPAEASTSHSAGSFDAALATVRAGSGSASMPSFDLVKMTKAQRKAKKMARRKARKAKRAQKRHEREQRMKQRKQQKN
jgi:hypothetical protein